VSTGQLVAELGDHGHRVVDADFNPNGGTLATASWDGNVRIFDVGAWTEDPDTVLEELRLYQGVRIDGATMAVD